MIQGWTLVGGVLFAEIKQGQLDGVENAIQVDIGDVEFGLIWLILFDWIEDMSVTGGCQFSVVGLTVVEKDRVASTDSGIGDDNVDSARRRTREGLFESSKLVCPFGDVGFDEFDGAMQEIG